MTQTQRKRLEELSGPFAKVKVGQQDQRAIAAAIARIDDLESAIFAADLMVEHRLRGYHEAEEAVRLYGIARRVLASRDGR